MNLIHRTIMTLLACMLFACFAKTAIAQPALAGIDLIAQTPQSDGTVVFTLRVQKDAEQYVDSQTLARAYGTDVTSIREANLTSTLAACGVSHPRVPQDASAEQALNIRASNGLWEGCADNPKQQRLILIQGETIKVTRGAAAMPVKERLAIFNALAACKDVDCVAAQALRAGVHLPKMETPSAGPVAPVPSPVPPPSAGPDAELNLAAGEIKKRDTQIAELKTALSAAKAEAWSKTTKTDYPFYGMAALAASAIVLLLLLLWKRGKERDEGWKLIQTARTDLEDRERQLHRQRELTAKAETAFRDAQTCRKEAEDRLASERKAQEAALEGYGRDLSALRALDEARMQEREAIQHERGALAQQEELVKNPVRELRAFLINGQYYELPIDEVDLPGDVRYILSLLKPGAEDLRKALNELCRVVSGAEPLEEELPFSVERLDVVTQQLIAIARRVEPAVRKEGAGLSLEELIRAAIEQPDHLGHFYDEEGVAQQEASALKAQISAEQQRTALRLAERDAEIDRLNNELATSKGAIAEATEHAKLLLFDANQAECERAQAEQRALDAEQRATYLETAFVESIGEIADYADSFDEKSGVHLKQPDDGSEVHPRTMRGIAVAPEGQREILVMTGRQFLHALESEPPAGRVWEDKHVGLLAGIAHALRGLVIYRREFDGQQVVVNLFESPAAAATG